MSLTTTDIPNLSNVTSMKQMFYLCTNFNGPDNIGLWNTSAVTNMSAMFRNASAFNKDINSWNVAAVTDMSYMFYYTFLIKISAAGTLVRLRIWSVCLVMHFGLIKILVPGTFRPLQICLVCLPVLIILIKILVLGMLDLLQICPICSV